LIGCFGTAYALLINKPRQWCNVTIFQCCQNDIFFYKKFFEKLSQSDRRKIMKIAVSSTGKTLDSAVEARFGRCPYFLIVNPTTMEFEAIANASAEQGGGAGIQSAQLIAEKGVSIVLTGNCGPNALKVFEKAGIQVIIDVTGPVSQAVKKVSAGSIKSTPSAQTAPRPPGKTGRGMGGGRGIGGGGRGMGGGGRGIGRGGPAR
jgi:predicted Fe-Mo cluster-binding NifX family protein